MPEENYNVIGVMSGTSLDGIDLARVAFSFTDGTVGFTIHECETIPYTAEWTDALKNAVGFSDAELIRLNSDYTKLLSEVITAFIQKHHLDNIDAVCSHGHTVLHQPQKGITLQIGNLPEIAILTRETVVCDFRVGDVQLGGQGAPLVPIGDRILFGGFDYCLNLGGFSNISFEQDASRIAFDISPVNTVLNFYADMLGYDYDEDGKLARGGELNVALLDDLNMLDYYRKPFPKSLGIEFVRDTIFSLMEIYDIPIENILRTFTEHIAQQISLALPSRNGKMLVTGGGAYNTFLIDCLREQLPEMEIIIPEKKILEFKEALIFALLGILKIRNEINVLSSVTGAKHDHSSGKIYKP
ncbi:MAG TPA: anhydro-N-acetylmuramic acid kinase [Flavobacterium sp.]|jgi:anhydro-N-acetylmuramic acid kinase